MLELGGRQRHYQVSAGKGDDGGGKAERCGGWLGGDGCGVPSEIYEYSLAIVCWDELAARTGKDRRNQELLGKMVVMDEREVAAESESCCGVRAGRPEAAPVRARLFRKYLKQNVEKDKNHHYRVQHSSS